ncbi:MAG: serine/threonine-protein kinase [Myxococcota bacterium]
MPAGYSIIDRLAVGGTAEIFRASRSATKDLVILKRLTESSRNDQDIKTLFELEADLGRQLIHPNIARMLEMGFDDDELFLVFEYLDGPNLHRLVTEIRRRQMVMPFSLAAAIMVEILNGLQFAHDLKSPNGQTMGLIHRDINARNVLTTFDGRVALIDFGIARMQGFEGGRVEEVVRGKLGSVAPEQLRREPLDQRADLFAAGVMLYELVIGSHPFAYAEANEEDVLEAIVHGEFISPDAIAPELPEDIRQLITASLSPKVQERPVSARAMGEALLRYADEGFSRTLADILRTLFPSQLAAVESVRFLAGA